jgi:cholesterol oxidase
MTFHFSQPFESLLEGHRRDSAVLATTQVLIIGTGYGGAVAAYRLSGLSQSTLHQHRIMVLERGKEYALGEFPRSADDLPGFVRAVRRGQARDDAAEDHLFDLRIGEGVDVLVGSGLGGTSLINANVALHPDPDLLQRPCWPPEIRTEASDPNSALSRAYGEVKHWLTSTGQDPDRLRALRKYQAFATYATNSGFKVDAAPIAVTLGPESSSKTNPAGVTQPVCTYCGDCVTGCNVGAKNTLAMNLIPAAFERGVEFITGAHALTVIPNPQTGGARWRVRVQATVRETRVRYYGDYYIEADTVILAAGTLGSTEILQRSVETSPGNAFFISPTLGSRFSTNGDALAVSFAENSAVHAVGQKDQGSPETLCGPTITAVAKGVTPDGTGFTLEDGAFPAVLNQGLAELITTSAQAGRLGDNRLPGWFRQQANAARDPLNVQAQAIENSQLFLIMTDDGARGTLRFDPTADDNIADVRVIPTWPASPNPAAEGQVLRKIDDVLSQFDRLRGMNDGQYVRNPLWQLLPPSASNTMSGNFPAGRLLSVHPLGGCPIAGNGSEGVVNHIGQVFASLGNNLHEGLFVLDGAIMPAALGINPFLTIAALSWRASGLIADRLQAQPPPRAPVRRSCAPVRVESRDRSRPARIIVSEQLIGQFDTKSSEVREAVHAFVGKQEDWHKTSALVIQLHTEPFALAVLDAPKRPIPLKATLYRNIVAGSAAVRAHIYSVPQEHLEEIAPGSGNVTMLAPVRPHNGWQRFWRTIEAFLTYFERRQSLGTLISAQTKTNPGQDSVNFGLRAALKKIRSLWNVAEMQATYRDFHYEITFALRDQHLRLKGTKRLAWRRDNPRLWESLLKLRVTAVFEPSRASTTASFNVDMAYMLDKGLIQVNPGDSVPEGILSCMGFAARMARCALQSSFWEFGAPDYPQMPLLPDPQLPKQLPNGATLASRTFWVPAYAKDGTKSHLRLALHSYKSPIHSYKSPNGILGPILLIHGLAQGSLIYAHPKQGTSLAEYLTSLGYDVWLLDHRLSNQFDAAQIPFGTWSIDEIGAFDVPIAVKNLLAEYPAGTRLHIFAHCVGATATAMAILKGKLTKRELESVALNAIHPWTSPSAPNSIRAKMGVFIRDWLGDSFFDPIIQTAATVSGQQSLFDRLGFSIARFGESRDGRHELVDDAALSNAICDRMTLLYGRMWIHGNVEKLHHHWKDLVGRAPGSVQRHLYYMLMHGRVTDHEGVNCYLSEQNLLHWRGIRTLFLHGEESRVFNPQSATISAIRLRRVFGYFMREDRRQGLPVVETCVRVKRLHDYGHMDPILAWDAHLKSFPFVPNFFQGKFDHSYKVGDLEMDHPKPDEDPHREASKHLVAGVVLRAARVENSMLILRVWVEVPSDITSPVKRVEFLLGQPIFFPVFPFTDTADPCRWADLALPVEAYRTIEAHPIASGSGTTHDSLESPFSRASPPPPWVQRLTTAHADCHFIVGSCRYPGTPFDRSAADLAFAGMRKLFDRRVPCDLLFLIGDQIYADATAGVLDPSLWRDRYTERYRAMFRSEDVRAVLNYLPCHFAVDDHEFADNFAGPDSHTVRGHELTDMKEGGIGEDQFLFARTAARAYMDSGRSDRPFGQSSTQPMPGYPRKQNGTFWYALDERSEIQFPAFILDTRSERQRATAAQSARLLGQEQLDAFCQWITKHAADPRPKFVFLGSPLVPLDADSQAPGGWMRQDEPSGYPGDVETIVSTIVQHQVRRMIFVGGDPHLSCWARLRFEYDGQSVDGLHVVSSGLYSPLPFANFPPEDLISTPRGRIRLARGEIEFEQSLLFAGPPHFLRISASPHDTGWQVGVEVYDQDGTVCKAVTISV